MYTFILYIFYSIGVTIKYFMLCFFYISHYIITLLLASLEVPLHFFKSIDYDTLSCITFTSELIEPNGLGIENTDFSE